MKLILTKLNFIALTLLLSFCTISFAATNIVLNGSFENGGASPSSWTLNAAASGSTDTAIVGLQSLKISGTGQIGSTRQTISLAPNTNYNVSVWALSSGINAGHAVFDTQGVFDGPGEAQFVINANDAPVWTEFTGTFNSGTVASIKLRMFTNAEYDGTVYFDNISVEADIPPAPPASGPNVVMFIVDDMNKEHFACFDGAGQVLTPNIDQLAAEGIKFEEAYVSATVCTPSRYTFATGRHPARSEYETYLDVWPTDTPGEPGLSNVGIGQHEQTIGHLLSAAGYYTGWQGKFHIGADENKTYTSPVTGNTVSEYDYLNDLADHVEDGYNAISDPVAKQAYMEGTLTDAHVEIENIVKTHITTNIGFHYADYIYRGNMDKPIDEHNMEWSVKGILEFLDLSQTQLDGQGNVRPFYLHFNTTLLHGGEGQVTASMDHPNMSGRGWLQNPIIIDPALMDSRQEIKNRVATAGLDSNTAGITWLDEGVGAVMKKLDQLGIADNTIFVFIPDHGTSNKTAMFSKNGSSVPLIIRYPALMNIPGVNKGVTCNELVQNIDMVPTILDLAGVSIPANYKVDGTSFKQYFSDPHNSGEIHDHLFFQMGHTRAILKDNFKYIVTRHTQPRINKIQQNILDGDYGDINNPPATPSEQLVKDFGYMGTHYGITKRGIQYNAAYLDFNQLYNMGPKGDRDPLAEQKEGNYTKNLLGVSSPSQAVLNKESEMRDILAQDLQFLNADSGQTRPFGEFDTGSGPATAPALTSEILQWYDYLYQYYFNNFNTGSDPDEYVRWKIDNGAIGDSEGDSDGDGLTDLMEYALGADPASMDADIEGPVLLRNGADFDFTFDRQKSGLNYIVEKSSDLVSWTTHDTNPGSVGADVTVTVPENEMTDGKLFLRLRVSE